MASTLVIEVPAALSRTDPATGKAVREGSAWLPTPPSYAWPRPLDGRSSTPRCSGPPGGHLDPDLVVVFAADQDAMWSGPDQPGPLTAVVSAEPGLPTAIRPRDRDHLFRPLSTVADLKGRSLLGHSTHTAELADAAGELGRAAVSGSIWNTPADSATAAWKGFGRKTIGPNGSCAAPPPHQLAEVAAGRHERLDGSAHHRGLRVHDLFTVARLPEAADVLAAITEPPAPTRAQTQRGRRPPVRRGRARRIPVRTHLTRGPRASGHTRSQAASRLNRPAGARWIDRYGRGAPLDSEPPAGTFTVPAGG
ncbi:hypothetical protein ACFRAQ_02935 [Nocardia sp. NPDC056611]|uniref:hypothetical protein n=1 Tax=Nocardia sp. NPDC056611 TaxID=3345877 RepID=UPI00366DEFED